MPKLEPATIIVNSTTLAHFFGVTKKCISTDWLHAGMPQIKRGTWDLKVCFDWWWENIAAEKAAKAGGDDSLNEAKRQYWWSKAEEGQLKVAQAKEDLVPKEEIHKQWAKRMSEYKNGCYGLINSLPPLLEGLPQVEMRKKIDKFVWSMFDRLTRTGKFCEPTKEEKD